MSKPASKRGRLRATAAMTRRHLITAAASGGLASCFSVPAGNVARSEEAQLEKDRPLTLKIGIRAASLKMVGSTDVIKTAAGIPGIVGVELQTTAGKANLRDWDVVRRYRREAERWNMQIPSLAGVWDRGVNIQSSAAGESLTKTIRAAEMLGSRVILIAFFRQNAPDMTREQSYGPVVTLLQETVRRAADAGVVMGLENSLSPGDNKKLVDLVGHPSVGVYYDPHNMAYYGHGDQAIAGIRLLGKKRIVMVHVKNGTRLLEEPGPINWMAAFREFNHIGYDGWYVYETGHDNTADCIEDTKKNNAFLNECVQVS